MTIEEAFTTLAKYSDNSCCQADIYVAKKVITEVMTKYISGVNLGLIAMSWDDYLFSVDENIKENSEPVVTTPFSNDLGVEQYSRELGEVHDTFNVEITQGNGNRITLTRQVIRCSQDDGSYLQSMVDVLSKLKG